MKRFIVAIMAVIIMMLGTVEVDADKYTAADNPFPVQLNGSTVKIEGYNINDSTYFKLRDISTVVGGFNVDFQNNQIQLSKDNYVYDNSGSASIKEDSSKDWVYTYSGIPYINVQTSKAKEINSNIENGASVFNGSTFSYEIASVGNMVSIKVREDTGVNDILEYYSYTFNKTTGKEITNSELLTMASVSEDEFLTSIKNRVAENFAAKWDPIMKTANGGLEREYYDKYYENCFSNDCVSMEHCMWLNNDGTIMVAPDVPSMAGASSYLEEMDSWYKIDTLDGERVVPNPYPIKLNGNNVNIEGYNIDGNTYFKLRDIADVVGGFDVDFADSTIKLSKDGYSYNDVENSDDTLRNYAKENILQVVDEDSSTIYDEVKFMLADITGDDKNDLLVIGINDFEQMAQIEVYTEENGNVTKISSDSCGASRGGSIYPVRYKGAVYLCGDSYSSHNGFMKNLVKYQNGEWSTAYSCRISYDNETGKLIGYDVNGSLVSEDEYNKMIEDIAAGALNTSDFVYKEAL